MGGAQISCVTGKVIEPLQELLGRLAISNGAIDLRGFGAFRAIKAKIVH